MPDLSTFLVILAVVMGWLISAVLLRASCSMCRVPKPGLVGASLLMAIVVAATVFLQLALGAGLGMSARGLELEPGAIAPLAAVLALPIHMLVAATIYKLMLPTTFGRAMIVWVVQALMLTIIALGFAVLLMTTSPDTWASMRGIIGL